MKFLIVFALCVVAALAAPADDVTILKSEFDNIGIDGYNFAYVEFWINLSVQSDYKIVCYMQLWLYQSMMQDIKSKKK